MNSTPKQPRIHLSAPDVRQFERQYVLDAIDSNWIAPAGPDLHKFENSLAQATGRRFGVALTSGTAALHLALIEAGVQAGDSVLCSTLTFIGSAGPIVHCGAEPVFIDSEEDSWNMDPNLLEAELIERSKAGALPKAAIVVDLYGNCADYDSICPILENFGVDLIEDAAEALGASHNGDPAGSFGRSAILSFNGNKIITSSGGGAFVTNDEKAASRVRYLATQAREAAVHYEHTEIGFNYRMSNICAALGRAQLDTLADRISRRREIFGAYEATFVDFADATLFNPQPSADTNRWLTCATLPENVRNRLIGGLEEHNIESRPVWKPMHLQPVFRDANVRNNLVSERLFATGVCLPSGSGMSDEDLTRVTSAITTILSKT